MYLSSILSIISKIFLSVSSSPSSSISSFLNKDNEKDFRDKCDTEEIYDAFMKEAKENPLFVQRYGQRFCKPNKQNSWDMIIRHGFYKPTVIKASF